MGKKPMYHAGSREFQQKYDSVPIADRLLEITLHHTFNGDDQRFIERSDCFFLATADDSGAPDCSYKGGAPGFVRVVGESTLVFPDYDGNGMFKSVGNIQVNSQVGLLFIDFTSPKRLRINGNASVLENDPLMASFPGAVLLVKVEAENIFPNCPRYIHPSTKEEISVHAPREGYQPPDAEWKQMDLFASWVSPQKDASKI